MITLQNKLDNIIYKTKSIEDSNYYWSDNYKVQIKNNTNNIDNSF